MDMASKQGTRPREVGIGVIVVLGALIVIYIQGKQLGWWQERYLVLATVKDGKDLMVNDPVYFRGVSIGRVAAIRLPEKDLPGYKVRMEVDKAAFQHLPFDSPIRVDEVRGQTKLRQVTILPGREKPDWSFPGQVKVLRELSPEEETIRMFKDVLDGLIELSRAKSSEAKQIELQDEIKRLNTELWKAKSQCREKK